MKLAQIPSAILWSTALLVTAAAPAFADGVAIFGAQLVSPAQPPPAQQMIITGKGFTALSKVHFGTANITTECSLGNPSLITCAFTPAITPGEYRLVVGSSDGDFGVFDVTAPLAGPAGPAGPTGAAGPMGPQWG